MGEWKVIADPGWTPPQPFNLMEPAAGGHIVDVQPPPAGPLDRQRPLTGDQPDQLPATLSIAPGAPGDASSWIAGFHHNRAAQITSLAWIDPPASDPALRFDRVTVEVSTGSPTGPWLPLAEWPLERDASGVATLDLAQPAWARFVRFTGVTTNEAPATPESVPMSLEWQLPDRIEIRELTPDDTYRSILGEWGGFRQEAIHEQLTIPEPIPLDADAGNDAAGATLLPLGTRHADTAAVAVDEDWYRVTVPGDSQVLTLSLTGEPVLGVSASLFDAMNNEIPLERQAGTGVEHVFTAIVEPGAAYLLRVTQPPTSVVIAFDTSFSIGPFESSVYQGLNRFAGDILKGRETANVLPFGAELLLPDWSDEPYLVQGAIAGYPRNTTSSDAEGALLTAMGAMSGREGNKAIILITDAETAVTQEQLGELWPTLSRTAPRIYSVGIAGSEGPAYGQDQMQDWASVNSGNYVYVRDQGEMDIAFDRAATELRRPSLYTLSVTAAAAPPTPTPEPTPVPTPTPTATSTPSVPGAIRIVAPPVTPGRAQPASRDGQVAIVFDTSGSMLQELDGDTRAGIARSALTDLVTNVIPAGTNVSLRTFGDTPDSCETRLVVPSAPLDPAAMSNTLAALPIVNLVKTPIGASLDAVAGDLGTGPGPKIVVLVTDGEETCGGDPAAAIEMLMASGVDVRVNIVGFAIDDEGLRDQFEEWARLGNGQYIDAANAEQLNAAVALAVLPAYEVRDAGGAVVASGQVGGPAVAIPAGTYQVVIATNPETIIADVTVAAGDTTDVDLPTSPP
ncbi:MAG: VWA domain-containing protein [Chloroflexia bacterium]|nr:VWA domain-containing protein [Chloroflexia bacterium]